MQKYIQNKINIFRILIPETKNIFFVSNYNEKKKKKQIHTYIYIIHMYLHKNSSSTYQTKILTNTVTLNVH